MRFLPKFAHVALLLICARPILAPLAGAQEISGPVKITLTTVDVPGAQFTGVSGINTAGAMVGDYGQDVNDGVNGFVYENGGFTYFDYIGQSVTVPGGINDSNLIVGYATQDPGQGAPVYGFLYDGVTFTTLQDGNDSATLAFGINNAGVVVGRAGSLGEAFAFEMQNGHYRTIDLPGGCPYTNAEGINNFGEVAAYATCGIYQYGYSVKNGKLRSVDVPGAQETAAFGINDSGMIVGWYNTGSSHSYAFVEKNGRYLSFGYPGAENTLALGINASGQIVGTYTFDNLTYHGFVTSPVTDSNFEWRGCCQAAIVGEK